MLNILNTLPITHIMNRLKLIVLLLSLFSLNACISDTYQLEQITHSKTKIKIYYSKLPICQYDVVGTIDINGFYFSKQSLFRKMAEEAEKLNADGVIIGFLEQLDIKEYVASGEAIRCKK